VTLIRYQYFLEENKSDPPSVLRLRLSPGSTFSITLVSRRPGDSGFASPVPFVVGGWMYREGQKEEAGDEEDVEQGNEDESG